MIGGGRWLQAQHSTANSNSSTIQFLFHWCVDLVALKNPESNPFPVSGWPYKVASDRHPNMDDGTPGGGGGGGSHSSQRLELHGQHSGLTCLAASPVKEQLMSELRNAGVVEQTCSTCLRGMQGSACLCCHRCICIFIANRSEKWRVIAGDVT